METREAADELLRYLAPIFRNAKPGVGDITRGEMAVLAFLCLERSPVNPTALSSASGLSTARIANTLNSLEKKCFIRRAHDAADRRKIIVLITDEGRLFARARYEEVVVELEKMLEAIGEEDTAHILRISKKMSGLVVEMMRE